MTLYVDDPDFKLHVGDVLEVLATMPDESVDCVVTSPPYWGLRDYGTGEWEGGDESCDHVAKRGTPAVQTGLGYPSDGGPRRVSESNTYNEGAFTTQYRDVCGKCGARRVDRQIGLEATPDLFVARMVEVFREVRRVLAPHGTCWVNLGDSYATTPTGNRGTKSALHGAQTSEKYQDTLDRYTDAKLTRAAIPDGLKAKDLVGVPWRVAFALQADGWWLRSDIIWSKPNPMPESVTDRPTKAHEYVFLLTKGPRYFFDAEAVREKANDSNTARFAAQVRHGTTRSGNEVAGATLDGSPYLVQRKHRGLHGVGTSLANDDPTGRNVRSVWEIEETHDEPSRTELQGPPTNPRGSRPVRAGAAGGDGEGRNSEDSGNGAEDVRGLTAAGSVWKIATQPYPEAHFATFPEELPRRAIAAGCPRWVCRVCGKPRERIVEKVDGGRGIRGYSPSDNRHPRDTQRSGPGSGALSVVMQTVGWSDCGHNDYRPGVVLDPFMGSGTTALVARRLERHSVGIELNPEYAALCARRLQQLSLLA